MARRRVDGSAAIGQRLSRAVGSFAWRVLSANGQHLNMDWCSRRANSALNGI